MIQTPFWNPVNEAQEKLQKKRAEALNPLYGISKFSLGSAIGRTNSMDIFKAMPTPKFPNIRGNHDYLDSSKRVVIEMGNLLHTLSQNYQDYYIFALERGEGNITVTLHCEEYSNEETTEIPIIVN
ncbi:hypothetical protein DH17_01040 [Acinetobacter oleivorans]|uniref:Uncharacterized protein n=2 Tax=Acinetobacter TaxID=469 RepID=A0A0B2UBA4_9GAMM|nr:hypothetical protein DH17_01040 [Acinetobacter oleivorans]